MKYQTKAILGGLMGNMVEAYDVAICYYLAIELNQYLMGNDGSKPTLILFIVFLGYLAKPVGAFLLGLLSDMYGRKNVLALSVLIMGAATTGIGLIPTYQSIGLASAGLLLLLRMIQSMALGSEFLNSASFLVESGAPERRGFRGCWSSVGVKAGYFFACLVVELLHYFGTLQPDYDWLWRMAFLLAALTSLVGFYVRYTMPESLAYVLYYAHREKPTTKSIYRQSIRFIKQYPFMCNYAFFASFLAVGTGFFFYLYIPLHAAEYSGLSRVFIIRSTAVSLLFVSVLIPLFGYWSDYSDRLRMLGMASIGLFLCSLPFMMAINSGSAWAFCGLQLLISIPCACYYSVSSVLLTELFPLQIRCTALSIIFSLAASLASGVPPLLANWLVDTTQQLNAPAVIMMLMAGAVLLNVFYLARYYRVGPNSYAITSVQDEQSLLPVEYQQP
ncbi:MAG: MFS transporter [Legionellaceae bacterium]|nr:MFS transporter [Legionellaceae bacterium]